LSVLDFFRPKAQFVFIEVPKGAAHPSQDAAESISTLQYHTGFVALMDRLDVQRYALETSLKRSKHETIEEVYFLQAGILWLDYLRQTVDKMVYKREEVHIQPTQTEDAEFARMCQFIERVSPQD
jgi:Mg2+ and Co2+ transporter CorA